MPITRFHAFEIILYSLLNLLPYLTLAFAMFKHSLRFGTRVTVLLIASLCVLQVFIGFSATTLFPQAVGVISLLSYALYIVYFLIAFKASAGAMLFLLFVLCNYASMIVTLSKCLEYYLFGDIALQGYRWTFSLSTVIVQLVTLPPLSILIARRIRPALFAPDTRRLWRYLWLIPCTFYLVWFYATYLHAENLSSIQAAIRPMSSLYLALINGGAMLVYTAVAQMVLDGARSVALERENHLLTLQNVQLSHLEERMEEARRARHDFRQHCSLLAGYCDRGDFDAIREYLKPFRYQRDYALQYCEHNAVNALLVYYLDLAHETNADISVKVALPASLPYADADLTVLMGNLLENAVEALRRQSDGNRFLRITASADGPFILTIDNSFSGAIVEKQRGFLSSKRHERGIGVSSVRAIAAKYGGVCRFDHADGIFRASVLLNPPASGSELGATAQPPSASVAKA